MFIPPLADLKGMIIPPLSAGGGMIIPLRSAREGKKPLKYRKSMNLCYMKYYFDNLHLQGSYQKNILYKIFQRFSLKFNAIFPRISQCYFERKSLNAFYTKYHCGSFPEDENY